MVSGVLTTVGHSKYRMDATILYDVYMHGGLEFGILLKAARMLTRISSDFVRTATIE